MNRRKVLKGLTAATAGSMGLAFGSGAFTQTEADRDFDVGLASDDASAQLVVEANDEVESVAIQQSGDVFALDAQNVSPDATTTYGRFGLDNSGDFDPQALQAGAFVIRNENETGGPIDVTVGIDFDESPNAAVSLSLEHPADEADLDGDQVRVTDASEDNDATLGGIPSTEDGSEETPDGVSESEAEIECGLIIDTTPDISAETLNLTLSVTAERSDPEAES